MTPEEARGATSAVKRLFFAVATEDGEAVWEALSADAQAYVVNIAVRQGMDVDLAGRLREGSAGASERREYLDNLTRGIAHDLGGVDPTQLSYTAEEADRGRVRVRYEVRLGLVLRSEEGEEHVAIPAGSALVIKQSGRWLVDRLVPRPGPGS